MTMHQGRRTVALSWMQRRELEQARDHDRRASVRERCAAVLKIADGASAHAVARQGLLQPRAPDTLSTGLDRYASEGVAGLTGHRLGMAWRLPSEPPSTSRRGPSASRQWGSGCTSHRARPPDGSWGSNRPVHRPVAGACAPSAPRWQDWPTPAAAASGVWRLLQRLCLQRRPLRDQLYSPDPADAATVAHLERCLREAVRWPQEVVGRFLDELGDSRWPAVAPDWQLTLPGSTAGQVHKAGPTNRQQRVIGALNALTGQVEYLDTYLVGRSQVSAFYRRLDQVYAWARRLDVGQDNWSIHHQVDVAATLRQLPRIAPVWLPTYAPWLNPIEKLWRWLRRDVLTAQRCADDWSQLRQQVNRFLAQFAHGSPVLLHAVGLVGDGHLAYVLRSP